MNKKLKTLCLEEIKNKLNTKPRVSNYIISFRIKELGSKEIEILNNLASMCKEIKVNSYKKSYLSIKLIFDTLNLTH